MDHKLAQKVTREAMSERIRYVTTRRGEVAKQLTEHTPHDIVSAQYHMWVGVRILGRLTNYMVTHVGRNAEGTTRYQHCKAKDYKHRARRRQEAAAHTFAHTVDQSRAWQVLRAQFIPGGYLWAKQLREGKRRFKSAVYAADIHVRTYGDYVGACAMLKGE